MFHNNHLINHQHLLINDLMDLKRLEKDVHCQNHGFPWLQSRIENVQIDNTIKSLLRDAKYNRRTDEVIANLALGRPYLPRIHEQWHDLADMNYDLLATQQARRLMAQKASRVLGCQNVGQWVTGTCYPLGAAGGLRSGLGLPNTMTGSTFGSSLGVGGAVGVGSPLCSTNAMVSNALCHGNSMMGSGNLWGNSMMGSNIWGL